MSQIILQPASGQKAQDHYINTVSNPVSMARIKAVLDPAQYASLASVVNTDTVCVWGMTEGNPVAQWTKIQPGDFVLFYRDFKFFSMSTVIYKCISEDLATELWGADWEYTYFFQNPIPISIDSSEVFRMIPTRTVLDAPLYRVDVYNADLLEDLISDSVAKHGYLTSLDETLFQGSLDKQTIGSARVEQAHLRNLLLDGGEGVCGICGGTFPPELLRASHIKKRSECTDAERRDLPNIAMLMCTLGCDSLYEEGFVTVDAGLVVTGPTVSPDVQVALGRLDGKCCIHWNHNRETYFTWHKRHTFQG